MTSCVFLFLIAVILAVVQKGFSLKCYNCSSPFGGYCDDLSGKNLAAVEECLGASPWCYHLVQNVDAIKGHSTFVQRGCSNEKHCNGTGQTDPVTRVCFACNLNLCNNVAMYHKIITNDEDNSSSEIIPGFFVISVAVLMFII